MTGWANGTISFDESRAGRRLAQVHDVQSCKIDVRPCFRLALNGTVHVRLRINIRVRLHLPRAQSRVGASPKIQHQRSPATHPKRPCAARFPGDSMCRYELLNTLIAYLNDRFFNPPIHFDF